jgi:hypothetical protein
MYSTSSYPDTILPTYSSLGIILPTYCSLRSATIGDRATIYLSVEGTYLSAYHELCRLGIDM